MHTVLFSECNELHALQCSTEPFRRGPKAGRKKVRGQKQYSNRSWRKNSETFRVRGQQGLFASLARHAQLPTLLR